MPKASTEQTSSKCRKKFIELVVKTISKFLFTKSNSSLILYLKEAIVEFEGKEIYFTISIQNFIT